MSCMSWIIASKVSAGRGQGGAGFTHRILCVLGHISPLPFPACASGNTHSVLSQTKAHTRAFFRDTKGSVPDFRNEANIAINQVT